MRVSLLSSIETPLGSSETHLKVESLLPSTYFQGYIDEFQNRCNSGVMVIVLPFPSENIDRLVKYLLIRDQYENRIINSLHNFEWELTDLNDAELSDYVDRVDYMELILKKWIGKYSNTYCLRTCPENNYIGLDKRIDSSLIHFLSIRGMLERFLPKILNYLSYRCYPSYRNYYSNKLYRLTNRCLCGCRRGKRSCLSFLRPNYFRVYDFVDLDELFSKITVENLIAILSHGIFGGPKVQFTIIYFKLIDIAWERTDHNLEIMGNNPYQEDVEKIYYDSKNNKYFFRLSPWMYFPHSLRKVVNVLGDTDLFRWPLDTKLASDLYSLKEKKALLRRKGYYYDISKFVRTYTPYQQLYIAIFDYILKCKNTKYNTF